MSKKGRHDESSDVPPAFCAGYMDAALWTSGLGENYDRYDIDTKTRNKMRTDCRNFYRANEHHIEASGLTLSKAGHDFWMTRISYYGNRKRGRGQDVGFLSEDDQNDVFVVKALRQLHDAASAFGKYHLEVVGNKVRGM